MLASATDLSTLLHPRSQHAVVGFNVDLSASFSTPPDEVTQRLADIVEEEAPELRPGFQWAVCS